MISTKSNHIVVYNFDTIDIENATQMPAEVTSSFDLITLSLDADDIYGTIDATVFIIGIQNPSVFDSFPLPIELKTFAQIKKIQILLFLIHITSSTNNPFQSRPF
jgi:hypothetical protein